jgi:3-oxoacyl-[acyl-carrier-protein] synthase-3
MSSRHSALRLAVAAARSCLADAAVPAGDLDLLINAGLYRDRNLGEPALAALIQEDIGANPEDPHSGGHGTFSFDVANGTAGPLTALQIADGFLRAGAVHRALIVASDADPGHRLSPNFPFAAAGAALLCSWSDENVGLGRFCWQNFPDASGHDALQSTVGLVQGRNVLRVARDADADDAFASAVAKVATESLDGMPADLIIAAPAQPRYLASVAEQLGVEQEQVVGAGDAAVHTAALIDALHLAIAAGRLRPGATALLVAAAAGITAGAVTYRVPDRGTLCT